MADEKKKPRRKRRRGQRKPPFLELSFGPIVRAKDNTFSTTIFIGVSGWWEGGRPDKATLSIGVEPPMEIHLHEGTGSYPLVGLEPESHLVVGAEVRGRVVERLLTVPSLPKPKRPEEEALEREKTELERARVAEDIRKILKPTKVPKKLYVTFSGEDGRQKLFISVSDESGSLIPDFPVIIVDGEEAKHKKTNGNGSLVYQLNFTERDRYVEVRAGNEHNLIWRARLNGPRR